MGAPKYQKIKQDLMEEIKDASVNTPIASERELAGRYNASRMTVRNAINELVEEGVLYRDKNKGTFVADQRLMKKNTSAETLNKPMDDTYDYNVIYFSSCFCDEKIAACLEIESEDWMIRIVRLNRKNGKPVSVEEIYLIQSLINDNDYNNLNKLLDLKGYIDEGSVTQKFLPIIVPVKYINLLHVKLNTPIIMVESTIVSKSGSPVVYIREFNNPTEKIIEITT
ncbi:GntR family transcriptional regulator [Lacrimispora celerecrescens]|uniref:GntR family transcriptional regulator n=1 Tax=Lacrimispora celerecrescens TaxID=29354 RepID=A0A084JQQ2_9FIRM|nr:GntR family transcriptional regulator [Lacrimispora celerecrescens]KEZ91286.1 GntR family transcriptional regulator [Lacrimispora celerecrescens]